MKRFNLLLTASLCFLTTALHGQYCESVANGDFYNPSIWSTGAVPTTADSLILKHVISADTDIVITASYVDFQSGSNLSADNSSSSCCSISITADEITSAATASVTCTGVSFIATAPMELHIDFFSYDDITLTSFNNWGSIHTPYGIHIIGSGRSNNYGSISSLISTIDWAGALHNALDGTMSCKYNMVVGDSLYNQGRIHCGSFYNDGYADGDSTGDLCVYSAFSNTGTITGTQNICDNTPGGPGDVGTGVFGPDLSYCADTMCLILISALDPAQAAPVFSPQPADELLLLEFSSMVEGLCTIVTLEGQTMLQSHIAHTDRHELDVSSLPAGFYLVKLNLDKGTLVRKIVVI